MENDPPKVAVPVAKGGHRPEKACRRTDISGFCG
jgi:hypothetical protein